MVADFVSGTCQPWSSPLVMIASKSDFEDKQSFRAKGQFSGQTLDDVIGLPKLIPKAGVSYKMAGGRHRFQAAMRAFEDIMKLTKDLQGKLEEIQKEGSGDGGDVEGDQQRLEEAKDRCQRELEHLEGWSKLVRWWPVEVYDHGLCFTVLAIFVGLLDFNSCLDSPGVREGSNPQLSLLPPLCELPLCCNKGHRSRETLEHLVGCGR